MSLTLPSAPYPREVDRIVNIVKLAKVAAWIAVIGFTITVFVVGGAAVIALF